MAENSAVLLLRTNYDSLGTVVVMLPGPFQEMRARYNSTETQQSGHARRSRAEIKDCTLDAPRSYPCVSRKCGATLQGARTSVPSFVCWKCDSFRPSLIRIHIEKRAIEVLVIKCKHILQIFDRNVAVPGFWK